MKISWTQVACDYCGSHASLTTGEKIYPHRPDLYVLRFWLCEPCDAYVGVHKGSVNPLGRLANADLRRAKQLAHAHFDPLWKSGNMSRRQAYSWLAIKMGLPEDKCHIGMFDVALCKRVVQIIFEDQNQCSLKNSLQS